MARETIRSRFTKQQTMNRYINAIIAGSLFLLFILVFGVILLIAAASSLSHGDKLDPKAVIAVCIVFLGYFLPFLYGVIFYASRLNRARRTVFVYDDQYVFNKQLSAKQLVRWKYVTYPDTNLIEQLTNATRYVLLSTFTAPWKESDPSRDSDLKYGRWRQVGIWLVSWIYILTGIFAWAVLASSLVNRWSLPSEVQQWAVTVIALAGGFVWQAFGFVTAGIGVYMVWFYNQENRGGSIPWAVSYVTCLFLFALPFLIAGALIRGNTSNALATNGAFLATAIKVFLAIGFPFITSLMGDRMKGALFGWLRRAPSAHGD